MNRNLRFVPYGLIGAAFLLAAVAAPAAWATPGQSALAQTIPTRTPTSAPSLPTEPPTSAPPATVPTTEVPSAPGSTPQPQETSVAPGSVATASTACTGSATFTLVAQPRTIYPGATVVFTATLTNSGRQALQAIVLEDQLAGGLDPVAVLSGPGHWQGRTLRASSPSLPVGKRLTMAYSARVAATQSGKAITARAQARIAGCPSRTATAVLGSAPSQLPATGGSLP